MKVLVTGSSGFVGGYVTASLRSSGYTVVEYDNKQGRDILDFPRMLASMSGCAGVVHAAAIRADGLAHPTRLMAANLLGTWNVLQASRESDVGRLVMLSSVNALGVFSGHRPPEYLPVDDDHPALAVRPYGLSKRLAEDMCSAVSSNSGMYTTCLRPPRILAPGEGWQLLRGWREGPLSEFQPFWEYGAYIDVRDVADLVVASLIREHGPRHVRLLVGADDIAATRPGRDLVQELLPMVEWRGGPEYNNGSMRALVDNSRVKNLLRWQPRKRWLD